MQQCIQPTGTNRPRAWRPTRSCSLWNAQGLRKRSLRRGPVRRSDGWSCPAECKISGGHGGGETPVPIPNTAVKPARADGTWGEAPWESRSPPGFLIRNPLRASARGGFVGSGPGCPVAGAWRISRVGVSWSGAAIALMGVAVPLGGDRPAAAEARDRMSPTRASATRTLESPDASELLPTESPRLLGALGWGPTSGSFRQRRAAERGWPGRPSSRSGAGRPSSRAGAGGSTRSTGASRSKGAGQRSGKPSGQAGRTRSASSDGAGGARPGAPSSGTAPAGRAQVRHAAAGRAQVRRTPRAFDGRASRPGRRIPATAPHVDVP